MRNKTLALTLVLAFVGAGAAYAHPGLKATTPAANGVVTPALKEIRLSFSEAIIPVFSGVSVMDANGKAVQTGKSFSDPKNKNILVVPLKTTLRTEPTKQSGMRLRQTHIGCKDITISV